jgi:hypothetical protein
MLNIERECLKRSEDRGSVQMKTYVVYSSLDENGAAEKQAIRLAGLNLQQSFEFVDMSQGADALDLLVSLSRMTLLLFAAGTLS